MFRAFLALTAAVAGALAPAEAQILTGSLWWTAGTSLLAIVLGIALISARRVRHLAWPWTLGAGFTSLFLTTYIVYALARS